MNATTLQELNVEVRGLNVLLFTSTVVFRNRMLAHMPFLALAAITSCGHAHALVMKGECHR